MKLTDEQRDRWLKAIEGMRLEENDTWSFDEEFELGGGIIAQVTGWQEVRGHDEYMWWVADNRDASAEVTLYAYDCK